MPRVKICGVTRRSDAAAAAEAGADAIGFNFWREGPRFVAPDAAAVIAASVPPAMLRVGVFVNAPRRDVLSIVKTVGLDVVQLHGDEGPDALEGLSVEVWKAFRGVVTNAELERFAAADGFVLDGAKAGYYGGSGVSADTASAERVRARGFFVLAGGLTPDNVAERIALTCPDMVDTASGVEHAPGIKDAARIRAFVAAAKAVAAA